MDRMAGVILCGGLGSRLGGVVKPLLRVGGMPILTRTIARLRPDASPLLISTGGAGPWRFAGFDADALIPDRPGPSAGPLAGLFAAVEHLRALSVPPEWLVSTAGDCPGLPAGLAPTLLAAVEPDVDVVFAAYDGQSYPPNALWRYSALAAHFDELGGAPQGRGPRRLVPPERRRDVDFAPLLPANPFEGLNDLRDLVRLARERHSGTGI